MVFCAEVQAGSFPAARPHTVKSVNGKLRNGLCVQIEIFADSFVACKECEMELTSGEMLYRANEMGSIGRKLYSDITEEFWQFLDASKSVSSNGDEMVHSNKSISASVEAYILKLRHRILTVRKAVEYTKYGVINEMNYENKKFTSALLDLQKRFDSEALQLVLQYYAIIQQEIETSRVKLVQENTEKELLFKQAAVLRDIRLFASHLMVESRGKLGFTMLPAESQQFARCVKAVMDNVQDEAFSTGDVARFRSRIKVLNVFKLQNSFLSGKLQVPLYSTCYISHVLSLLTHFGISFVAELHYMLMKWSVSQSLLHTFPVRTGCFGAREQRQD
jgi:hypothetical protein